MNLLRLRAVLDHGPLAVEVVVMGVWLAPINTSSAAVAGLLECGTVHFSQPKLLLLRSSNVLFEPLQHSFGQLCCGLQQTAASYNTLTALVPGRQ